jgi:hypothetical protein
VIRLHSPELLAGFRQLVGDHQRRHDGEACIANLAELAAQRNDALVEILGELPQMILLAVFTGHAELAAVDRDIHLRHGILTRHQSWTSILSLENESNALHGGVEPARDLAVRGFKATHLAELRVEVGGKLGTIRAQRVNLLREQRPAALNFHSAVDRRVEDVQRLREAPGGGFDRGLIGHRSTFVAW